MQWSSAAWRPYLQSLPELCSFIYIYISNMCQHYARCCMTDDMKYPVSFTTSRLWLISVFSCGSGSWLWILLVIKHWISTRCTFYLPRIYQALVGNKGHWFFCTYATKFLCFLICLDYESGFIASIHDRDSDNFLHILSYTTLWNVSRVSITNLLVLLVSWNYQLIEKLLQPSRT